MPPELSREAQLLRWVAMQCGSQSGLQLQALPGDAGQRRYYRVATAEGARIAVDAPPATENSRRFIAMQQLLAAQRIRVPKLYAQSVEQGFLLLEDLGDQLLWSELQGQNGQRKLDSALGLLQALRDVPTVALPSYDADLLAEELSRFERWFVRELLGCELLPTTQQALSDVSRSLIEAALSQPQVFVHRDFHSRNIMCLPDGDLALIDFQDAVRGPVSYDAISLLRDCYLRREPEEVRLLAAALRPAEFTEQQWLQSLDWMGLQRHLKVLGTFARLYLRDGKTRYLADIPQVWRYVLEVLEAYRSQPAFTDFAAGLRQELEPRLQAQSWWSTCA